MPGTMVGPRGAVLLQGLRQVYLLLARFSASIAAPLPSPLGCDVGSLTVTDADNVISQAGGQLVINGTPAASSGLLSPSAFTRKTGRALLFNSPSRTINSATLRSGWSASAITTAAVDYGLDYNGGSNNVRIKNASTNIDSVTLAAGVHDYAFVLRSTGCFGLARVGLTGPHTLRWVFSEGTANQSVKVHLVATATLIANLDDVRVVDLGGQWSDDYGIASQRLAGARNAGDTFTHPADCLIEWTETTVPSAGNAFVRFRIQDSNNYWGITVASDGSIALREIIAGGSNSRANTAPAAVTNGARLVVVMEASTIKAYINNVLAFTYASASNFATSTSGDLNSLATGGAISDIVAWPRTISLPGNV